MKEPIHHLKTRVRFGHSEGKCDYWSTDVRQGWLYTKVKDSKGVEIAEGDIVDIGDNEPPCTVRFFDGAFWLDNGITHAPLLEFVDTKLEVIGHVMENEYEENHRQP